MLKLRCLIALEVLVVFGGPAVGEPLLEIEQVTRDNVVETLARCAGLFAGTAKAIRSESQREFDDVSEFDDYQKLQQSLDGLEKAHDAMSVLASVVKAQLEEVSDAEAVSWAVDKQTFYEDRYLAQHYSNGGADTSVISDDLMVHDLQVCLQLANKLKPTLDEILKQ